jgi:hypothetical protein
MGDYSRHSPSIWRSFYIEMDSKDTNKILKICNFLTKMNIRFCFQRYGEWKRRRGDREEVLEPEHVSFRLIADDIEELTIFRGYLKGTQAKWTEGSWDEEWRVKKAYEVGTQLFLVYMKEMEELEGYGEITDTENYKGFILQMLHGFFNDLNFVYRDERILMSHYLNGLTQMEGFTEGFYQHLNWLRSLKSEETKK